MIEILHTRDPDAGCDFIAFIDGKRVSDKEVSVADIDPGRGYQKSDWDEHTEWVKSQSGYSPAFREAVLAERAEAADSSYIVDDEPDGWDAASIKRTYGIEAP